MEVRRLSKKGLVVYRTGSKLGQLMTVKVLIRAHGEPPETYKTAIEIIRTDRCLLSSGVEGFQNRSLKNALIK